MRPDFGRRLERLDASRDRALSLLAPHDPAALNRAPAPGRCVPQVERALSRR